MNGIPGHRPDVEAAIARLLRDARTKSGLTTGQLASKVHLAEADLARIEAGGAMAATPQALRRIAVALSVAFADA